MLFSEEEGESEKYPKIDNTTLVHARTCKFQPLPQRKETGFVGRCRKAETKCVFSVERT